MRAVGRIRLRRGIFSAAWRKIFKRGLGATSAESAANGKITDKVAFKPRDKIAILSRLMRIVFQTASAQLGLRFKPQACILRQSRLKQHCRVLKFRAMSAERTIFA